MEKRYNNMFKYLKNRKEAALIPFITIGDPSRKIFLNIVDTLIYNGSDGLELGIPFSDPLADGPIIQKANKRALKLGINIIECFKLISIIRNRHPNIPIGILIYVNIIYSYGIKNFYDQCYKSGIDSVLIVDVPIEEFIPFYKESIKKKILPVLICPPNADDFLLKKISSFNCAYTYVLSRAGITGINEIISNKFNISNLFSKLIKYNAALPLQGFGIYKTRHIKNAINNGAYGVILGSFIIKLIEDYQNNSIILLKKLKNMIIKFKSATIF
ncbi:tryptophan synthase subunit alpha [Enterobacteriaceae endosymbiont of Plateumaris consimilis]|uniref:tryptophan synthase subunit alpha n=1 Tax=Enterobacteriaceae endosymbiont of Plateumaris consimilis TaxID=2675794 RepID=UPI001448C196|nr:tryptophan synthase subunit alpha [Enterobacteriaceae endosymbiont of Plateumaris consimilis]QJC28510.1 tryptophan synthase subunit alpha [Enterobacteriaceae endosymbiont of Plateumaris consimilis]